MGGKRSYTMPHDPIIAELRRIRLEQGLSFMALANLMDRDDGQCICRNEKRKGDPRLETLHKWANALGYELILRKKGTP